MSTDRFVNGPPREHVLTVAEIVQDMEKAPSVALTLTDSDRAAIERSKEDFRTGRTYTNDEYHAEMTVFMAELKSKYR